MRDEIFWGNLIGLLKTGKWTMNLQEVEAFVQVYQEAAKRSRPLPLESVAEVKPAPIEKPKKEKVKNGNK